MGAAKAFIVMVVISAATLMPWVLTYTYKLYVLLFSAQSVGDFTNLIVPELLTLLLQA